MSASTKPRVYFDTVITSGRITRDLKPDADAKHVMYAANKQNDCDYFITLDSRDLLPQRAAIEALCPHLKIRRPIEFIAEFGAP